MRSPAQINVAYHACSLPPFARSYYGLLQQKVPAGYNGHEMCTTYVQTVFRLWGYMHATQHCTCMHIQRDFDLHNITYNTA